MCNLDNVVGKNNCLMKTSFINGGNDHDVTQAVEAHDTATRTQYEGVIHVQLPAFPPS